MPVRRETQIDADQQTSYEAVRKVLSPHVERGSFLVWEDDPGAFYGIASKSAAGSARYRFALEARDVGTHIEGTLWLGGILAPLHSVLRHRGNRKHIDDLLDRMKRAAEGRPSREAEENARANKFEDDELEDDEPDDEDNGEHRDV